MSGADVLLTLWGLVLAHLPVVMNVAVASVVCIMIGCRVAKMMRGVTSLWVFVQHAALAVAMFCSILLSFADHSEWAAASASGGVLIFLLMSVKRWRLAPPADTNRLDMIQPLQMRRAARSKP